MENTCKLCTAFNEPPEAAPDKPPPTSRYLYLPGQFSDLISNRETCAFCRLISDGIAAIYGWGPQQTSPPSRLKYPPYSVEIRRDYLEDATGPLVVTLQHVTLGKLQLQFYTPIDSDRSPWEAIGQGHNISPYGLSKNCIQFIKGWLEACTTSQGQGKHPRCTPPELSDLPSRVIDVELLRLHCKEPDEKARYVALSHCWGCQCPIQTTTENLDEHVLGLPALPPTFADAVAVTKALGIRYLWIDSLCIVQNSKEDWHAEVARMAEVYENAFFTISADAAADANEGFLRYPSRSFQPETAISYSYTNQDNKPTEGIIRVRERGTQAMMLPFHCTPPNRGHPPNDNPLNQPGDAELATPSHPQPPENRKQGLSGPYMYMIRPRPNPGNTPSPSAPSAPSAQFQDPDSRLPRSKLSTRGWVFQERVLAPRTLHFSQSELAWECQSTCTCECSATSVRNHLRASLLKDSLTVIPGRHLDDRWRNEIVQEYSCLDLTVPSDRLVALSGFVKRVVGLRGAGDVYLAGLWRASLARDMLWYVRPPPPREEGRGGVSVLHSERVTPYCAPTWSWAAVTGAAAYIWDDKIDRISHTFQIRAVEVSVPEASGLFGSVREGSHLVVRGVCLRARPKRVMGARPIEVRLDILTGASKLRRLVSGSDERARGSDFLPIWDTAMTDESASAVLDGEFLFLLMAESKSHPCGMLLRKSHRGGDAYERVAYVGQRDATPFDLSRRGSFSEEMIRAKEEGAKQMEKEKAYKAWKEWEALGSEMEIRIF